MAGMSRDGGPADLHEEAFGSLPADTILIGQDFEIIYICGRKITGLSRLWVQLRSGSHQVHDFINTAAYFFRIRLGALEGRRELSRG